MNPSYTHRATPAKYPVVTPLATVMQWAPGVVRRMEQQGLVKRRTVDVSAKKSVSLWNSRQGQKPPPEGCITLKRWIGDMAEKHGCSVRAMWMRYYRGWYEKPELVRIHRTGVYVKV